jgi:hypothetical protein
VADDVAAAHRPGDIGVIEDVADDERGSFGDVLPGADAQVVEHRHPAAARQERAAHVRTDEPGAAGDAHVKLDRHVRPPAR